MEKSIRYLWLLALWCAHGLFGQSPDAMASTLPQFLSASGFEAGLSGSVSFAIGALGSEIVLDGQYSDHQEDEGQKEEGEGIASGQNNRTLDAGSNGFSRPFEGSVEEGVGISIYPNPFVSSFTLTIDDFTNNGAQNYHFALFDIVGNELNLKRIESGEEKIAMNFLSGGLYILRLFQNNKEIRSFRLLKTNP